MVTKLSNGLKIIHKKTSGNAATVHITVGVGSINEKEGEKGYSHFVEHMLFEGTTNRPDAEKITSIVENVGGEINAMTSNELTTYYVKTLGKHVEKAIDVLSDMIKNPLFAKEKVAKEARVISEEIKMILDQPRYYQWLVFEKALFEKTPYETPVYGLVDDVMNATPESLQKYYQKHYTPDNCIITIVGNVDNIEKLVSQYFEDWKGSIQDEKEKEVITIPNNITREVSEKKQISQLYIIHGCVTPNILTKDAAVFDIIEALLGRSQSGWINDSIRNKHGLGYDVGVTYETLLNFGFFAINVGTEINNKEKVLKLIKEVIARLETVTEDELNIAKQYVEGQTLLEIENTSRHADILSYWTRVSGKDMTSEYLKKVFSVTTKEIADISKKYFEKMTTITITP